MSDLLLTAAAGAAGATITYLVMRSQRRLITKVERIHRIEKESLEKQLRQGREHDLYREGWEMGTKEADAKIEALKAENVVLRSQVQMESMLDATLRNGDRAVFGNSKIVSLRGR